MERAMNEMSTAIKDIKSPLTKRPRSLRLSTKLPFRPIYLP